MSDDQEIDKAEEDKTPPNPDWVPIGERLIEIRQECKLGQKQLFGTVSSQRKISKVEVGKQKVDLEILLFWAEKGYNTHWILTGVGFKKMQFDDEIKDLLDLRDTVFKKVKNR